MSTRDDDPQVFELANGIRLRLRHVSPRLMKAMRDQSEEGRPKPPMITREDRGDRQEPNEDDPEYRAAFTEWVSGTGWRVLDTLVATCATVEHVPDDIPGPDTDEWATELAEVYKLPLEANPKRRLAQWVLLQTTDEDLLDLGPLLMAQAGVQEEDVQRALDSFRSGAGRTPDSSGATDGGRVNGDTVPTSPPRSRAARRRTAGR